MKTRFLFIIKYFCFWLIFFTSLKLLFLLYYAGESFEVLNKWPGIFLHGLRLDLSATGYLMLLPLLLLILSTLIAGKVYAKIIRVYTLLMIGIIALLAVSDLALYHEWGFRMDATPLLYLTKPSEALASLNFLHILALLSLAVGIFFTFNYLYKYLPGSDGFSIKVSWWNIAPAILLFGSMILPIRGGTGTSPINVGVAYFTNIDFVNHAGINLPWNILYSFTNLETNSNPYQFTDDIEKASALATRFTSSFEKTDKVLATNKPNIILILLESFSAEAVSSLSSRKGTTPNLDSLAQKGILFTNCFASGNRTDKGFVSVFSGFPAQPTTSLIKFPNKTQTLPSLTESLAREGYITRFYYGGDIEFANYQSYLLNIGFQELISQKDFPLSKRTSSWGVPDEYLFEKIADDIADMASPFFISGINLNSHPPYDIPSAHKFEGESDSALYLSSIYYTDSVIGAFINTLKTKNLLENTLLVFVSDHGSRWPRGISGFSPASFHIPMIWYGDVLNYQDTLITKHVNQTDIAATILAQLDLPFHEFPYSNNLFDPEKENTIIYAFNNGFGIVNDSSSLIYQRIPDRFKFSENKGDSSLVPQGKAFYQLLYDDIMER